MSGLPEGMANGPSQSEHLERDAQVWERPWTLEEMRQNSANWSLAADSGLVLFLQDFSQRMLSKTHEIEKQLDSLIRDTKATDSCLHSVFNDFLMLSNTQFIENRVYDEEVEDTVPKPDVLEKQPEQEKTREQKEAELIPKVQEAVNYGLKVLESAFEHLDIKAGNSDSEDEEANDRMEAILEPKDLYVDRPLPYLIGSQAFMEQDDVGLGDLSSDEMSVDSERDSVIESEDGKDADHSDDFNPVEDEGHNNIKKKSSMLSYDDEEEEEEEDEDSDIFGDSDKDDDDDAKNTGPSSFADELAARIKGEPVNKPEGDRASLASKKKSKGRKESKASKSQAADDDSDDMFKPPKMDYNDDDDDDDEFSPFGGKSGLFSGGRGLFDDDDEGDLFSEAPKSVETKTMNQSTTSPAQTAESAKPGKKIPAGGVSIFPENSLFSSGNDTESVGSKENGTPAPKSSPPSKPVPTAAGIVGGLFDDEEDEDDFFGSQSIQRSDAAGEEKPTSKTALDLFAEEDEDGDIFGAAAPALSKKEAVAEQAKPPEKKVPAGAISMFGPGTKSLLSEGLKKRQQSTSEGPEKSEENGPAPDVGKPAAKPSPIPKTRGLFSDDEEDTPVFPNIPRSQSKPESTNHSKSSKAALSFFDDEEEEDLFASAAKSKTKPNPAKVSPAQPSSTVSSSLFSDDEDQWLGYKSSVSKPESKTGGMKPSASAPSSLPSAKTSKKSSLFDNGGDDDDLFGTTKETSQKKSQRVALLFEDEDEAGKESLFGTKPSVNTNTAAPAAAKNSVAASQSTSQSQKSEEVTVCQTATEDKPPQEEMPTPKTPEPLPSSASAATATAASSSSPPSSAAAAAASAAAAAALPENSGVKKKPAGAVSLFGGIDILGNRQTKILLDGDDSDDDFLSKAGPPPVQEEKKKEDRVKTKTVSLFEDGDVDEPDWNDPIFTPSKPTGQNTPKSSEERPQAKSTGVFLDEELLFSHTQQKDNDPDVDLFATSGKAASSKLSSAKPAAQSLFADDDEDDLFSSTKPKPPKIAEKPSKPADKAPLASPESVSEIQKPAPSPVNPKDSSSRIGKLQANLKINPAALLPGAGPVKPGAISILPGMGPSSSSGVSSSSLSPSPVTTPVGAQAQDREEGVSFDTPVQVATLPSAHKSRAKGANQRRPQSRSARQQAAQRSVGDEGEAPSGAGANPSPSGLVLPNQSRQNQTSPTLPNSSASAALPPSSSSPLSLPDVSPRPSELTLPISTDTGKKDSGKKSLGAKVLPLPDEDDLFGSDGVFEAPPASDAPSTRPAAEAPQPQAVGGGGQKKDKDKSTFPSIFDDNTDDLFKKVKPRSTAKKVKPSAFLEDDDDDEDIFGMSNSSTPSSTSSKEIKSSSSFSKQDIFQDDVAAVPKVQKKHKEKTLDSNLFDDDVDIFADLTDTLTPKQKSKTKGETKSIFDDDMDEIFSSSTVKPLTKASHKSKKTPPSQESNAAAAAAATAAADSINLFDDPLNALGGD